MVLHRLNRALGREAGKPAKPGHASPKPKKMSEQLVDTLLQFQVDLVIDVGANRGQYGQRLRRNGYAGQIVSFEPQPDIQALLIETARADQNWIVAPPMALGAQDGTATLQRSAESDMSSLLPQNETLKSISPSSAVGEAIEVPLHRLDGLARIKDGPFQRMFLKVDVQGTEPEVLEGALGILDRVVGIQVECAMVPLYEGEQDFRVMLDLLPRQGYDLHLVLPGYYERKLARQLQVDLVFFRRDGLPNDGTALEASPDA